MTISAAKLTLIRFTSGQKPVHLHVLLSHPISYQYRLSPIYQLLLCGSTPCRFTLMAAHPSLPHYQRELMLSYFLEWPHDHVKETLSTPSLPSSSSLAVLSAHLSVPLSLLPFSHLLLPLCVQVSPSQPPTTDSEGEADDPRSQTDTDGPDYRQILSPTVFDTYSMPNCTLTFHLSTHLGLPRRYLLLQNQGSEFSARE